MSSEKSKNRKIKTSQDADKRVMLRRAAWRNFPTLEGYLGALTYRNDMRAADYVHFVVHIGVAKREAAISVAVIYKG